MNDPEDKLFEARLADALYLCERNSRPQFSAFLDERRRALAEKWLERNAGAIRYSFWGGFPEAKRTMLAVFPDYCEPAPEDFPMKCLTFSYRSSDKLTHRDFLGSFMGAMLKRETVGDIVVGDGLAQAFLTETAANSLAGASMKIGRAGVKVSSEEPFRMEVKQEFQEIAGTVASLRLDCIICLATRLSREKAAALIRSEKVDINCFTASSVSAELREGDALSVRGFGKFVLARVDGLTKKGRLRVELRKFI